MIWFVLQSEVVSILMKMQKKGRKHHVSVNENHKSMQMICILKKQHACKKEEISYVWKQRLKIQARVS